MSEYLDFVNQKIGKQQDKTSFTKTCSMLSQYLKERGCFGDLSLGMTRSGEINGTSDASRHMATTMSLFPIIDKPTEVTSRNSSAPRNLKSMDLFPQEAGFSPSRPKEDGLKATGSIANKSMNTKPQAAQMTIFYGGQVIVLNDLSADKAKEIMLLASKGTVQTYGAGTSNLVKNTSTAFSPIVPKKQIEPLRSSVPSTPIITSSFGTNVIQDLIQDRVQASPSSIACELPIMRRASLHRFLEKRKDRITAKAPYQVNSPVADSHNTVESKPWLDVATKSPQ